MPTREETPIFRGFVDTIINEYAPYRSNGTPVNDNGYVPYISGTPVNDGIYTPYGTLVNDADDGTTFWVRNLWDEEWEPGEYVDADGETHRDALVSRHYIPISPEHAYGFTICTPYKNAVFHFYDRYHNEIGCITLVQGVDTEVVPPEHAYYMKFVFEGYGDMYNNDIFMTLKLKKDSLPLSEESIKNFKSFIGGQI